jgi:anti-sigma factor RsiW
MNRRDMELLSSYLDGQLKPSETTRLEARLSTDPGLRAVLDDLRSARGLLRQLPMRKAPRNFTLTPKMVGKNPPLPRSYPAFRFVTALASLLLFFTVGLNFLAPQMASQSPGFGGGGAPDVFSAQAPAEESAATEAPAAAAPAATEAPVEEPSIQLLPQPTENLSAADNAREIETPMGKDGFVGDAPATVPEVPPAQNPLPTVSPTWQIVLAVIALLGALIMVMMRQTAASRWRRR